MQKIWSGSSFENRYMSPAMCASRNSHSCPYPLHNIDLNLFNLHVKWLKSQEEEPLIDEEIAQMSGFCRVDVPPRGGSQVQL